MPPKQTTFVEVIFFRILNRYIPRGFNFFSFLKNGDKKI